MHIKKKSKIIGWDDGPFEFDQEEMVPVVGAVTRGGELLDGVIKTEIEKDGISGTERLASSVNDSKHKKDLKLIMLDGITFGGLNVIDIYALSEMTGIPVLAATKERVDRDSFKEALTNLPKYEKRWKAVKKAGKIRQTPVRESKLYYQKTAISSEEAERAIAITATNSTTPEPIRLANLISKSFVCGES